MATLSSLVLLHLPSLFRGPILTSPTKGNDMSRKRSCAVDRRVEQLRQLGKLADLLLHPADADRVLLSIGAELQAMGIYQLTPEVDPQATIH